MNASTNLRFPWAMDLVELVKVFHQNYNQILSPEFQTQLVTLIAVTVVILTVEVLIVVVLIVLVLTVVVVTNSSSNISSSSSSSKIS